MKETLIPGADRRDAGGLWTISPGVKNAKHVFVFIQKSSNVVEGGVATANPYAFDAFAPMQGLNSQLAAFSMGRPFIQSWSTMARPNSDTPRLNRIQLQKKRCQHRDAAERGRLLKALPHRLFRSPADKG